MERTTAGESLRSTARRVLVVDDHPIVRLGISQLLAGESDLAICGSTGCSAQALALMRGARVDVAIVDLSIEAGAGLDLIRTARETAPAVKMLALSATEEPFLARLVLEAGARGYLLKADAGDVLVSGIRRVLRGETVVSPRLTDSLATASGDDDRERWLTKLSRRECEVFDLIGEGVGTNEIARRLRLSVKTVETYRAKIKTKLGLTGNADLIRCAAFWRTRVRTGGRAPFCPSDFTSRSRPDRQQRWRA